MSVKEKTNIRYGWTGWSSWWSGQDRLSQFLRCYLWISFYWRERPGTEIASVFTGWKNTIMPRSIPIGRWELVPTLVLCFKHKYAASLISESARAKTKMPSCFPIGRPGLAYCADSPAFPFHTATMSKRGQNFSPDQNLIITYQSEVITPYHPINLIHEGLVSLLKWFFKLHFSLVSV